MIEKIGNVRFFASTYSPDEGEADVHFSHDCDTGECQLVINLGTKEEALAVERGRRIVRLWQLVESATQHAEPRPYQPYTFWSYFKFLLPRVGRRRGPDPSRQPGRVSQARTPTRNDKQGKCQE